MGRSGHWAACLAVLVVLDSATGALLHAAEGALRGADGRYLTAEGSPTYAIAPDGTVDWSTYSGFRRYHAECHVCHGPDGEGGTFAPSLLPAMRSMGYDEFKAIITQGSRSMGVGQQQVMRPMGDDPNVMCFLDEIYVYLKARADGALGRGRPQRHGPKPAAATQNEAACLGR
jgi:methanol metabolism-related c-type cytochrome